MHGAYNSHHVKCLHGRLLANHPDAEPLKTSKKDWRPVSTEDPLLPLPDSACRTGATFCIVETRLDRSLKLKLPPPEEEEGDEEPLRVFAALIKVVRGLLEELEDEVVVPLPLPLLLPPPSACRMGLILEAMLATLVRSMPLPPSTSWSTLASGPLPLAAALDSDCSAGANLLAVLTTFMNDARPPVLFAAMLLRNASGLVAELPEPVRPASDSRPEITEDSLLVPLAAAELPPRNCPSLLAMVAKSILPLAACLPRLTASSTVVMKLTVLLGRWKAWRTVEKSRPEPEPEVPPDRRSDTVLMRSAAGAAPVPPDRPLRILDRMLALVVVLALLGESADTRFERPANGLVDPLLVFGARAPGNEGRFREYGRGGGIDEAGNGVWEKCAAVLPVQDGCKCKAFSQLDVSDCCC